MDQLTSRQREILDFIRATLEERGSPPTRLDICAAFGFASPNAAEAHLKALAKKGAIALEAGASRGIRLMESLGLPIVGRVAAGSPILSESSIDAHVRVDPAMFAPRADFLLRVRGLSMIEVGILEGDLLAVHRTSEVRDGQIIVARVDDEVTVKRLRRSNGLVELLPENHTMQPIVVDPQRQSLSIEGRVVGLIRDEFSFT
ncbi:transcriptional repressor LexA [Uliginosibacterium sediminicola]|uniref:LexA repressor n=1 Tax=Uliginosibacterium sediminicola TaxID=2024550 RepID=A0ABU9Z278_9RHOO